MERGLMAPDEMKNLGYGEGQTATDDVGKGVKRWLMGWEEERMEAIDGMILKAGADWRCCDERDVYDWMRDQEYGFAPLVCLGWTEPQQLQHKIVAGDTHPVLRKASRSLRAEA
jgi:hypothetical protein